MALDLVGLTLEVVYEDLSDVWPLIGQEIQNKIPLPELRIRNRFGTDVVIRDLPVRLMPWSSSSPRASLLSSHTHSAAAWFRRPVASLVCISCNDSDDFKRNFRLQLRAMVDPENSEPLAPEIVFVYVRPLTVDPESKGPARAIDAMRRELGTRGRERVVRIDPLVRPARSNTLMKGILRSSTVDRSDSLMRDGARFSAVEGIEDLLLCLERALSVSLERRIQAYGEEARQQLSSFRIESMDSSISIEGGRLDTYGETDMSSTQERSSIDNRAEMDAMMPSSSSSPEEKNRKMKEGDGSEVVATSVPSEDIRGSTVLDHGGAASDVVGSSSLTDESHTISSIAEVYLLKDSLAAMLESAGMLDDALLEYLELDTTLQKLYRKSCTMEGAGLSLNRKQDIHRVMRLLSTGGDEASLIFMQWANARKMVRRSCDQDSALVSSLILQQAVFSNLYRLLMKLKRYSDVLRHGLRLIENIRAMLEMEVGKEAAASWTFTVSVSLASAIFDCISDITRPSDMDASLVHGVSMNKTIEGPRSAELEATDLEPAHAAVSHAVEKGAEGAHRSDKEEEIEATQWNIGPVRSTRPEDMATPLADVEESTAATGSMQHTSAAAHVIDETSELYNLLGKYYVNARWDLEQLGSSKGLKTPSFIPQLEAAASTLAASAHRGGSGGAVVNDVVNAASGPALASNTPSRSWDVQTTTPSRHSGDVRSSLVSARTPLDSDGEEVSSSDPSSLRAQHVLSTQDGDINDTTGLHNAYGSVQESQMDTVDLHHPNVDGEDAKSSDGENQRGVDTNDQRSKVETNEEKRDGSGSSRVMPTDSLPGSDIVNLQAVHSSHDLAVDETSFSKLDRKDTALLDHGSSRVSLDVEGRTSEPGHFRARSFGNPELNRQFNEDYGHSRSKSEKTGVYDAMPSQRDSGSESTSTPRLDRVSDARDEDDAPHIEVPALQKGTVVFQTPSRLIDVERLLEDLTFLGTKNVVEVPATSAGDYRMEDFSDTIDCAVKDGLEMGPYHWRLRQALQSQGEFSDLWSAVSIAAAICFRRGGSERRSMLLRCHIADFYAERSQYEVASRLYEDQCRLAMKEGWFGIACTFLPKLVDCQARLMAEGLRASSAALISLLAMHQNDNSLKGSRNVTGIVAPYARKSLETAFSLFSLSAMPQSIGGSSPLPLPIPFKTWGSHGLPFDMIDFSTILNAYTTDFSRFNGSNIETDKHGRSSDPVGSTTSNKRHRHVSTSAGSVSQIKLWVTNRLQTSLPLRKLSLVLIGMEKVDVMILKQAVSGVQENLDQDSHRTFSVWRQSSSAGALGFATSPRAMSPKSFDVNEALGRQPSFGGVEEEDPILTDQFQSKVAWHDVERLSCPLTMVISEGDEAENGASHHTSKSWTSVSKQLDPLTETVHLRPGMNQLTFLMAPTSSLLFRPYRMVANFNGVPVQVGIEPSMSIDASGPVSIDQTPTIQRMSLTGKHKHADVIVAAVEAPDMHADACGIFADGSALFTGQQQWFGMLLQLPESSLQDASLRVTWPHGALFKSSHGSDIIRKGSHVGQTSARLPTRRNSHARHRSNVGSRSGEASGVFGAATNDVVLFPASDAVAIGNESLCEDTDGRARDGHCFAASVMDAYRISKGCVEDDGSHHISLASCSDDGLHRDAETNHRKLLVYWWLSVPPWISPPVTIQVTRPVAAASSARLTSGAIPSTPAQRWEDGRISNGRQLRTYSKSLSRQLVDLPVCLEYVSGCPRSLVKVISLPVAQPFMVKACGYGMPNGGLVLHYTIQSHLPYDILVQDASIEPQPGLSLREGNGIATLSLLPLILPAYDEMSLSFILDFDGVSGGAVMGATQSRMHAAAKSNPTALILTYLIEDSRLCGARLPMRKSHHHIEGKSSQMGTEVDTRLLRQTSCGEETSTMANYDEMQRGSHGNMLYRSDDRLQGQRHQERFGDDFADRLNDCQCEMFAAPKADLLRELIDASVARQPLEQSIQEKNDERPLGLEDKQVCTFVHQAALEFSNFEGDAPETTILVKLLGPFSATVGVPTSLCWRLERMGPCVASERLEFELMSEGEVWRPLGHQVGTVALGAYDGACATVESVWIPSVMGKVQAPALRLVDVPYKEVLTGSTPVMTSTGVNWILVNMN